MDNPTAMETKDMDYMNYTKAVLLTLFMLPVWCVQYVLYVPARLLLKALAWTLFLLPTLIVSRRRVKRERHEEMIAAVTGQAYAKKRSMVAPWFWAAVKGAWASGADNG